MTRWSHAHTFMGGLLAGLLLDHSALALFLFGAGVAVVLMLTWRYLRGLLGWGRSIADAFGRHMDRSYDAAPWTHSSSFERRGRRS